MTVAVWVLVVALGLAHAETAATEDTAPAAPERIEPFSLADQHGREHRVDASVSALLISRDMDAGRIIKGALAERGALLASGGVVYVADVSAMPALVRRIFAEPSLRKRPYPMLLDREGVHVAPLPHVEGKATLIRLDALRVVAVEHIGDEGSLIASLEGLTDVAGAGPEEEPEAAP